jgi:2'-5' RNA ligase
MLSRYSSKIEKIVQRARDTNGKVKVFLGGSCKDNAWRDEITKEFGDYFFFIDPFDDDWEPEDNIYDELAGMINSDYVVFYKGGDLSEREQDFLKNIGRKDTLVPEFEDLGKLKEFLRGIQKKTKKLSCVVDVLRRCAVEIDKDALVGQFAIAKGVPADFLYEDLDTEDRKEVMEDLDSGETINIPELHYKGKWIKPVRFSKYDFDLHGLETVLKQMEWAINKPSPRNPELMYDETTHSYMHKEAKVDATYSKASTQIELPAQLAQEIFSWGKANVPDKDLYTKDDDKGREDEIHTTLFYGILDDDPTKVQELLRGIKPFECRLGIITAFKDKKEYDVLKIDIESPEQVRLHYLIRENVKNKNDYPTYSPHLTVAYVKKGGADRLIGEDRFRGVTFRVDEIVFSTKDHVKIKIPLGM